MRFKVGDKVKFLNENGGGTVISILDSKLVKIETDEGFEMPVLNTELIKDARYEDQYDAAAISPSLGVPSTTPVEEIEESSISEINPWGSVREEKGIYFAFEPHEQQWVLTGDLDVLVVNNTPFEILYNLYFNQNNKLSGVDFGSVPANSKIILETINRDEIENWCSGYLQLMLHNELSAQVIMPIHSTIDIKPSRFYKEGSYQSNTLLQGKALILSVAPGSTFKSASGTETEQKHDNSAIDSKAEIKKEQAIIDKHRTNLFEAEVDLHIAELVNNISGMSNHDMFNTQLTYFRNTLASAISNDYRKVTFIHGVGNGVLKNAIVKELDDYEGIENKMASISKFGVGAIDILIKTKDK